MVSFSRLLQNATNPVSSVVQRQQWLMRHKKLSRVQAYDQARHEFYEERQHEDVERRVAKEEALYVGANFGRTTLEKGMAQEDRTFENWKAQATKVMQMEARVKRAAKLTARAGETENSALLKESTVATDEDEDVDDDADSRL